VTLDCLIIGYNDPPFESYERLIRSYGKDSEAYRDLQFSFVDMDGSPRTYVDLLNYVRREAAGAGAPVKPLYSGDIPNLAAAYLASFLRKYGFSAEYINLFQVEKEKLAHYLAQGPRCVAITTTFYVINAPAIEIVDFVRHHNPATKIIVGGPLIGNHARRFGAERQIRINAGSESGGSGIGQAFKTALAEIGADIYVVEGQGEATLVRIVDRLRRGADVRDIPNIVYMEDGEYFRNPSEPEENDLDATDIDWFALSSEPLGHTIQMRTARSCAFSCSFCNYPARAGKLRLAGLETIKRELDSIRRRGDVRNVVFIDDTFNVPLERFKEICRLMIRERYGFNWYSYFRCSNSDQEAFDLMAESGCKGVFLGIESGAPSILKLMNKAAKPEQYEKGIRELKHRDILTFASFIVGFPGETEDTVKETVEFITRAKPDFYRAQLWYCEAGTPVELKRAAFGIEGDGFIWRHHTMDSLTASDHIERMFLIIRESAWLPQWSFDFWIIPYLCGQGIGREVFRRFMREANKLLALQIASVDPIQKRLAGEKHLGQMIRLFR